MERDFNSVLDLKKLRPRIKVYTFEKGLLNSCYQKIKKVDPSIKTVCLPKIRLKQKLRKNYHGRGYSVYQAFKKYIYKGYILLPEMSRLSKVMDILSLKNLIADARIT